MKQSIQVNRADFFRCIKVAAKIRAQQGQAARFLVDGGRLHVSFGGHEFSLPAEGNWVGEALVPGAFVERISKAACPGGEKLTIAVDDSKIKIDILVLNCQWNESVFPRIELPLGATECDVLKLARKHSPDEVERSGLRERVLAAQVERDKAIVAAMQHFEKGLLVLVRLGFRSAADILELSPDSIQKKLAAYIESQIGSGTKQPT